MAERPLRAGSCLERVLHSGRFAVTAELAPFDTSDQQEVLEKALVLSEVCDAINVTDASGAHVHMSSLAACAVLTHSDYEPVFQMSCRDCNRIAQQAIVSSIMGSYLHSIQTYER